MHIFLKHVFSKHVFFTSKRCLSEQKLPLQANVFIAVSERGMISTPMITHGPEAKGRVNALIISYNLLIFFSIRGANCFDFGQGVPSSPFGMGLLSKVFRPSPSLTCIESQPLSKCFDCVERFRKPQIAYLLRHWHRPPICNHASDLGAELSDT